MNQELKLLKQAKSRYTSIRQIVVGAIARGYDNAWVREKFADVKRCTMCKVYYYPLYQKEDCRIKCLWARIFPGKTRSQGCYCTKVFYDLTNIFKHGKLKNALPILDHIITTLTEEINVRKQGPVGILKATDIVKSTCDDCKIVCDECCSSCDGSEKCTYRCSG